MSDITLGIPLGKGKAGSTQKVRFRTHHRARMFAITLLSDLLAFAFLMTFVHIALDDRLHWDDLSLSQAEPSLFFILCLSLVMMTRLYPGIGLNPVFEIKSVAQLAGVSFLIVLGFLMIRTPIWTQEKLDLVLIGGLSIPAILGMRWSMRILAVQLGMWGEPVAVLASPEKLEHILHYFDERRRLGFLPILGVTLSSRSASTAQRLALGEVLDLPDHYFSQTGIQTVLVGTQIVPELSKSGLQRQLLQKFKHLIFVSEMDWLEGASLCTYDFEGVLAMEARQHFLTLPEAVLKRLMDILLSLLVSTVCLPLLLLTAVLIKLDSPGPVFYQQGRLGKGGRRITLFKFRSMQVNADEILAEYLTKNPQAQQEWLETQKLRADPRITRVGKWIRKFSVDELPQLFNIMKGEMSLVGPRPIMIEQKRLYGEGLEVYSSVRPGLTGFWQVSGRNRTSFSQRAAYDLYYVRNWSFWLDTYILLRTVWVVLSRDGAY